MAQTVRATTDHWCNHLHLLRGGPAMLMVYYEEKKIFALYVRVKLIFWCSISSMPTGNTNQVAQSPRFTNNGAPPIALTLYPLKNVEIMAMN
jgi:hypothetical protein